MSAVEKFNALNGCQDVTRDEIQEIIALAQNENCTDVIFRCSKVLNDNPSTDSFNIEIETFETALNAPRHTGDYKEALDECGRLRKGFKFENGSVVKVTSKTKIHAQVQTKPINKNNKSTQKNKKTNRVATRVEKKQQVKPVKNQPAEKQVFAKSNVIEVPIKKINIDVARFQNRNKLNQDKLNYIVNNFSSEKMDPVMLWKDQTGKIFLLAGHHRLRASEILDKTHIQAKFFSGTEKEAIHFAKVESNANRTLETPLERAKIYRELRNENISKKEILEKAKTIEGKNANEVLNLSYLKPNGVVVQALESLDNSDKTNRLLIEKIADWIGEARKNYGLTDAHEKEMFDFLTNATESARFKAKSDFLQKINAIAGTFDFEIDKPLNLKRFKYKSEGETVYEQEYNDLKTKIETLIDKKAEFKNRVSNPKNTDYIDPAHRDYNVIINEIDKQISKINNEVKHYQEQLINLQRNKGKYINQGSNQVGLFGVKNNSTKPKLNGVLENVVANVVANTVLAEPIPAQPKHPKVKNIAASNTEVSEFFTIDGEVAKFLQRVERKKTHSVVITIDGPQGAGKTTMLYQFMQSFAAPGNNCLFISGEEHPDSELAKEKANKHLSDEAKAKIDTVAEVENKEELYSLVSAYDVIFIDSWQKLQRMIGEIKLDEDLRKKFNGKVFVIIFQQTTTGRTKGGAEVVFDGDIIIKMHKDFSFEKNYAYFDKNRYTLEPIENLRYNIATGTTYNPNQTTQTKQEVEPAAEFSFAVN